jgi:hypothetical protein
VPGCGGYFTLTGYWVTHTFCFFFPIPILVFVILVSQIVLKLTQVSGILVYLYIFIATCIIFTLYSTVRRRFSPLLLGNRPKKKRRHFFLRYKIFLYAKLKF